MRHTNALNASIRTSVLHSYFMLGDCQRCLEESQWLTDPMIATALISLGRPLARSLRTETRFLELMRIAEERHWMAAASFTDAGRLACASKVDREARQFVAAVRPAASGCRYGQMLAAIAFAPAALGCTMSGSSIA